MAGFVCPFWERAAEGVVTRLVAIFKQSGRIQEALPTQRNFTIACRNTTAEFITIHV
jgi:hypothetical protein